MGIFSPRLTSFIRPSANMDRIGRLAHRSFRLSKPAKVVYGQSIKKEVERKSFGSFIPKQDKKTLEALSQQALHHQGEIKDKDIAYYGRQRKSEYHIGAREEKERFVRGMYKEAHAEHLRFKGFHPAGHEYEEAHGVVGTIDREHTPPPPPPPVQEPRPIDIVRQRLGIQHGPAATTNTLSQKTALPTPTAESSPTHAPSDHATPHAKPEPAPPRIGDWQGATIGFGPVRPHGHDESAVGPGVPVVHHDAPPAPDQPASEPSVPDTSQVDQDLPL